MGQFSDYPSVMGMMSVQGYHAGAIRQMLIGKAYEQVYGQSMQVYQLTAVRELEPPRDSVLECFSTASAPSLSRERCHSLSSGQAHPVMPASGQPASKGQKRYPVCLMRVSAQPLQFFCSQPVVRCRSQ